MILCQYCSLSNFKTALHLFTRFVTSRSCLTLLRAIYPANCRSPQTRANSGELRANSPAVRRHLYSAELRRTFAGVRRTFAERSPEFARVRPYSAANWRTVCQKIRSREEILTTSESDERHVRRELSSPRMKFAHGELQFTKKHILDGVNDREQLFASGVLLGLITTLRH